MVTMIQSEPAHSEGGGSEILVVRPRPDVCLSGRSMARAHTGNGRHVMNNSLVPSHAVLTYLPSPIASEEISISHDALLGSGQGTDDVATYIGSKVPSWHIRYERTR